MGLFDEFKNLLFEEVEVDEPSYESQRSSHGKSSQSYATAVGTREVPSTRRSTGEHNGTRELGRTNPHPHPPEGATATAGVFPGLQQGFLRKKPTQPLSRYDLAYRSSLRTNRKGRGKYHNPLNPLWIFFSFQGRVSRLNFTYYNAFLAVAISFFYRYLFDIYSPYLNFGRFYNLDQMYRYFMRYVNLDNFVIHLAIFSLLAYCSFALHIKRWHDMGLPGLMTVIFVGALAGFGYGMVTGQSIIFLMIFGLTAFLYTAALMLFPGDHSDNFYGRTD